MASAPDGIVLDRHRDLQGRRAGLWWRRGVLGAIGLFCLLGLLNVFGQHPETTVVDSPRAKLTLYAPTHLRGGLLYSARFHIVAHSDLKLATVVLDPGWAEGMSINTIEPSPIVESSSDGKLALHLGPIKAGNSYILYLQLQVNPTNVAWQRSQDVRLYDGKTLLLTVHRAVNIYP